MEGFFEVYLHGQAVGKVEVRREGLYYCFLCRCRISSQSVCKLTANDVSLGILVPMGDGFGLETKLPVKRFGSETWDFQVMPNRPVLEGRFVPIKPEEPFAYLERLKDAYLVRRDGQVGVFIRGVDIK